MSDAQQIAIAIIPKFSAFISILGSGFIIYDILCSHFNVQSDWWKKGKSEETESHQSSSANFRKQGMAAMRGRSSRRFAERKTLKNSAYYRLMLSMSTSDFIVSFAWFMTTWPIPKDENSVDNPSDIVYGNSGTMQTCTAQAFFIQLGIVTPFYNALLSCYYYLTIRREWKEEEFKKRVEWIGHIIAISFGLGTSIAGLVMKIFHNSKVWCWINSYPMGCGDGPGQTPCLRGHNSKMLRWAFYYGPLWFMISLVAFFMTLVYCYVRGLDNKMARYTSTYRKKAARSSAEFELSERADSDNEGDNNSKRRSSRMRMSRTFSNMKIETLNEQRRQRRNERSKAVANQGLFYAGTFALVWLFGTVVRGMQLAGATPPWAIIFLFAVFTPSQGFFNFLVFIRPRLIKYFSKRKKLREGRMSDVKDSSSMLHVSGISGLSGVSAGSQNDNTGDKHTRDSSCDMRLSDPFISMKEIPDDDDIDALTKTMPASDGPASDGNTDIVSDSQ